MKKPAQLAKSKTQEKSMEQPTKVTIRKLPTGVRCLDDILGGGIPEFSFNIIAGLHVTHTISVKVSGNAILQGLLSIPVYCETPRQATQ